MAQRTLTLASPVMRGKDVAALQALLAHSAFGDFHPGEPDGQYGPLTAAAVHRAKWALGYRKPNRKAGDTLRRLLHGTPAELPRLMQLRRKRRLAAGSKREQFQTRGIAFARSQVGVHESPAGSNLNPYGRFWREDGVPWCGLFVCRVWKAAGASVSRAQALTWDFVPALHAAAQTGSQGVHMVSASNVAALDAVCLFHDEHVEVFARWVNRSAGTFATYGGNTSSSVTGSQSNGGEVAPKTRHISEVSAFVRKQL